ncbi:MAG: hypothetical protein HETSPECPRED_009865 [Heterodermia speciosa]|uniref:Clavaminate synthase-like protein n=1 Tax=Heterodermia speciosa TaxID=116794 RepID=A0A8H3IVS4_9LECA|nr:MAG: hypothetical protein HETSPECPRED_009865 [Heterodermia speciosa]
MKGSYYVNCAFYQDPALRYTSDHADDDSSQSTSQNVWPSDDVLPGFRNTFEELCTLVIDTAVLVARACDRYASANIDGYQAGYLERVVKTSTTTKARLLHYFPSDPTDPAPGGDEESMPSKQVVEDDDWCATHIDHGCLTGLTSALYIDESTQPSIPQPNLGPGILPPLHTLPSAPSLSTGLYIKSRTSAVKKVDIPPSCLGFQTGEALQLITGGKFRAVPHFVRAGGNEYGGRIARNTLAVFTQPNLEEVVDTERGLTFAKFSQEVGERFG